MGQVQTVPKCFLRHLLDLALAEGDLLQALHAVGLQRVLRQLAERVPVHMEDLSHHCISFKRVS